MSESSFQAADDAKALDAVVDRTGASGELAAQLFAVVDLLDATPALRRVLTDPSTAVDRRQGLADGLLQGRVADSTLEVVRQAVARRHSPHALGDALERQAVRVVLRTAQDDGGLADVEDQLFRFGRLVDADPELRFALTDRSAALARRQHLAESLLQGKARPQTIQLAARAVKARSRAFGKTLSDYVSTAASLQNRTIATVRVARSLEADQRQRLQAALARQIGHDVTLQEIVEPHLLGGVRVEFGDEVIEGTVAARLGQARRQLGNSAG